MPTHVQLSDELLISYTKQDLLEMCRFKKIDVKASWRKNEIVGAMTAEMLRPEIMSRYLCWLTTEECCSLLSMAGIEGIQEEAEVWEEEFPWRLLFTGYMFFDEEEGELYLPEDVRALIRKVWTPELQAAQRKYTWIRQCLDLGTQLYGVMPYHILARLLRQKVQYGMAVSVLPQLPEDIPAEINPYGFTDEGIYMEDLEPVLSKLEFPKDTEDYYIPSVMEIENHIFYTMEVQNQLRAKINSWQKKSWPLALDVERLFWMLCSLKAMECATCHMEELIALQGETPLYDEEAGELTVVGEQLCRMLQKSDRLFRRVRYHGFNQEEWEKRQLNRYPEQITGSQASDVREPPRTAKIISLDEQRRQRAKRRKQ